MISGGALLLTEMTKACSSRLLCSSNAATLTRYSPSVGGNPAKDVVAVDRHSGPVFQQLKTDRIAVWIFGRQLIGPFNPGVGRSYWF